VGIYQVVSCFFTWLPAAFSGLAFENGRGPRSGFSTAFYILQTFLLLLVAFGVPETAFDRSFYLINTPASSLSTRGPPLRLRRPLTVERVKAYLADMTPWSYEGPIVDTEVLLQAPRALLAPTTVLLTLVTFLPFAALWSLAASLGELFAATPFSLPPTSIGLLMTGTLFLATTATAFFAFLPQWHARFVPRFNTTLLVAGSTAAFLGLLTFGLYAEMRGREVSAFDETPSPTTAVLEKPTISFPGVSALLGVVGLAAYTLDASTRPLVKRSVQFTSANLAICLRNGADMAGGVAVWRSLLAGVFVIGLPSAVAAWDGLKAACAGFAVAQVVVAAAVGAVWWRYDENVRRLDGHVMGLIDVALKRKGSFFDMD
jgi:hypothetical protein